MPLNLPAPDQQTLARSPLALVVCQIRYDDPAAKPSSLVAANIRNALIAMDLPFNRAENVHVRNVNLDLSAGTAERDVQRAWRLISPDGRWTATIGPDSLSLETTRYESWQNDFQRRLFGFLRAFTETVNPQVETRVGLRFVDFLNGRNRIVDVSEYRWWVRTWLLGAIADNMLAPGVKAAQQQISLEIDEDIRANVRHGPYPDPSRDNAYTYVLDTDVYRESLRRFDVASIEALTERLHDTALSLFQCMVTPDAMGYFRGEGA